MLKTKITNKKKYVFEGAGIFDSIANFFGRMFSSNAAKQLASAALQAGKTAAKDIWMKAIDVGKTVSIDAGNKLAEEVAKKLSTPKSQVANVMFHQMKLLKKITSQICWYKCN